METAGSAYERAKKMGSTFSDAFSLKSDNELIALSDIISGDDIRSEVKLGYREIATEDIVGTKNKSRALGFTKNFMPTFNIKSEFGNKWQVLYSSIVKNGTLDAIKVYEYLHKYYVEEGNKRVSVNKFLGAPLMGADVIRVVPKYDENNETIVVYYEFMEFYKRIPIDFIEFTKRGSYKKFYKIIMDMNFEVDDLISEIKFMYIAFRKAYLKYGGNKIKHSVGDAFLKYLEIYDDFGVNLYKNIKSMWAEFTLVDDEKLQFETDVEENMGFVSSIANIGGSKSNLKVAFINPKNPKSFNWTYVHDLGRKHVEKIFGDKLEVDSFYDVPDDERAYDEISKIADDNYDVIFTTSATYMSDTIKASLKYKNTKFLNASENFSSKNVRTYYSRLYEANFLLGIVAGMITNSNRVGVVVSYPIPEVIRSLNAFTLGGKFVNKDFNIFVKWVATDAPSYEDVINIDEQFLQMDCDIVWNNIACSMEVGEKLFGLYVINDRQNVEDRSYLGCANWNWGVVYEKILDSIFDGTYSFISSSLGFNNKAISYMWGLDMGSTYIDLNEKIVSFDVIKTVNTMKKLIMNKSYNIFEGPLKDKMGEIILDENELFTKEKIREIDFLVEGVIGSIPSIDINNDSEEILSVLGVKQKY